MENKILTGYPSIDKPWLKHYRSDINYSQPPQMSAYEYLKHMNSGNLDKTAIKFLGNTTTYSEMFNKIDEVAEALCTIGIGEGDVVVISLPALPEEVYLFYALDKIGACSNFVIPNTPTEKICDIIDTFDCKCFVTWQISKEDEATLYAKSSLKNIILTPMTQQGGNDVRTTTWNNFIEKRYSMNQYVKPSNERMVFIAKTGGSTGASKSVALSAKSFNDIVHQFLNSNLDYKAGDKWLRLWPIFSASAAVCSNHLPLCAGMELILEPTGNIFNLDKMLVTERANHIPLAPAVLDALFDSSILAGQDLSFIKTVGCGGSKMTEEFEKKTAEFFKRHNIKTFLGGGYGMTENGSNVTFRMDHNTSKIGSAGIPMIDTTVAVFNPDTFEEQPYNTLGEICIKSTSFMLGYYGDEEMTKKVLRDHGNGDVWLHSGDLGYIDEDGFVYIIDRLTRVITRYPCNKLYPSEIESNIEKIYGIEKAAVFGMNDPEHDGFHIPACAIIIKSGFDANSVKNTVIDYCENNIALYAKPEKVLVLDSFPLTTVGKVDYITLGEKAKEL
ncbi:MAG: acyl--CoA ligase [Clostridia bacterium]|nr:acyl--CoA ligase [Clostridia bacterium]